MSADWSQTTPQQLLAAYLTRRSEHTQRAYTHDLDCYARYCGLPSRLEAVQAFVGSGRGGAKLSLMAWAQAMSADGVAPNTIRRRIGALRGLATLAADCEVIPWTVQMRLPAARTVRDTRGPSRAAVREMLQRAHERMDAKGRRDELILRLAYNCALRASELLSLDVRHIDLDLAEVSVLAKGLWGRTLLPIPRVVVKAVAAWLEARPAGDGPLLMSLDNIILARGELRRLSYPGLYAVVSSYGREVGISCRPHGLRHAAATEMDRLTGGHMGFGMALTRHRDPKSWLVYNDASLRGARQAQEILAAGHPVYDTRDFDR